jgi:hypothetical protein
VLFHLLILGDQSLVRPAFEGLTVERFERTLAYIDEVMGSLHTASMVRSDAEDIMKEFRWVADLLQLACHLGIARLQGSPHAPISALPAATRTALADQLRPLIDRHRRLWRRRNRSGGLDDSAGRLQRILARLEG